MELIVFFFLPRCYPGYMDTDPDPLRREASVARNLSYVCVTSARRGGNVQRIYGFLDWGHVSSTFGAGVPLLHAV